MDNGWGWGETKKQLVINFIKLFQLEDGQGVLLADPSTNRMRVWDMDKEGGGVLKKLTI